LMGRIDQRLLRFERDREQQRPKAAVIPEIDDVTLLCIAAAVATVLAGRGRVTHIRRLLPSDSPRSAWSLQGRMILLGSHQPMHRQRSSDK
jgi:hypothetical protein